VAAKSREPLDFGKALLEAWATNAEVTRYLLEHLDGKIWGARPPAGKGRTIASAFAHIHNVRRMLLVMARATKVPPKLDRFRVTREEARAGLDKSAEGISRVLEAALSTGGHVRGINRDAASFLTASVVHEAHVRGQICMAARALGHPLSQEEHLEMWEWEKRRKAAVR
jgi:uncharacterized damage-inducible protein DinB